MFMYVGFSQSLPNQPMFSYYKDTSPSNPRFNSFSNETLDELSELSQSAASYAKRKQDIRYHPDESRLQHQANHPEDDDEFTPSISSKIFISKQKNVNDGLDLIPFDQQGASERTKQNERDKYQNQNHHVTSENHVNSVRSDYLLQGDLHSVNLESENHHDARDLPSAAFQRHLSTSNINASKNTKDNDILITTMIQFHNKVQTLKNGNDIIQVLSQKIKEMLSFAKSTADFIKKRSQLEAEYAKNGTDHHLSNQFSTFISSLSHSKLKGKNGACHLNATISDPDQEQFPSIWEKVLNVHRKQDESRHELSKTLQVVAENIGVLIKNTERSRKQLKESATRQCRLLQEAEAELVKARTRFEAATFDWEKMNGRDTDSVSITSSMSSKMHGIQSFTNKLKKTFKPRLSQDEIKARVSLANSEYKNSLSNATNTRKAVHTHHIPRLIESFMTILRECQDELQRYIEMYARIVEDGIVAQGEIVAPIDSQKEGLLSIIKSINFKKDVEKFVDEYCSTPLAVENETGNNTIDPSTSVIGGMYFGSNLDEIMDRDPNQSVPNLVMTCTTYIEESGIFTEGIYKVAPNQSSRIDSLRAVLESNPNVFLEDVVGDVHAVSGVLKLFFRELSEPLVPYSLYKNFINAAKGSDEKQRLIRVHEQVNALPDASYATLKHMALHLNQISLHQDSNHMSIENLAMIWGPIFIDSGLSGGLVDKDDLEYCCKAVELIIRNVQHIFEV